MLPDRQLPPEAYGPPAVVLDAEGVTLWLGGTPHSRILWSQVDSVKIGIVTVAHLGYSEAFWQLTGDGVEFIAPVEVIVNADQLSDRLFNLPGFDVGAYRRAVEAESQGRPGEFVCWRKTESQPLNTPGGVSA